MYILIFLPPQKNGKEGRKGKEARHYLIQLKMYFLVPFPHLITIKGQVLGLQACAQHFSLREVLT